MATTPAAVKQTVTVPAWAGESEPTPTGTSAIDTMSIRMMQVEAAIVVESHKNE